MSNIPNNLPVPFNFAQQPMLIEHSLDDGDVIHQRPQDGYVNATELCHRAGKLFGHYNEAIQTKAFLEELSLDIGIPISNLVQVVRGRGDRVEQGTWVHPRVAINLGQWLSPSFAVKVSEWVFDWMEGRLKGSMPEHVQRYLKNRSKVPPTHFSMLNEIYLGLLAPLEDCGMIPPDSMMPDISTGRMFSGFLRQRVLTLVCFLHTSTSLSTRSARRSARGSIRLNISLHSVSISVKSGFLRGPKVTLRRGSPRPCHSFHRFCNYHPRDPAGRNWEYQEASP